MWPYFKPLNILDHPPTNLLSLTTNALVRGHKIFMKI